MLGVAFSNKQDVGASQIREVSTLLSVHDCAKGQLPCRQGVVKPIVKLVVIKASERSAQVNVSVSFNIGRSGVIEAGTPGSSYQKSTETISSGVPTIQEKGSISRTAEIPLGMLRRIELPYGVAIGLCVSSWQGDIFPDNGACSGIEQDHLADAAAIAPKL
jgi:hypothetical protein